MSVEVKNLQTGETYEVGPEGAIFGREGGPANIKVADQSVSKRHARLFSDGTDWFLEDMGSVNGTIVDGGKIGGITALRAGLVFQMSKFRFEVISIDGRGAGNANGGANGNGRPGPDMETRTAMRGGPPNGNSGGGALQPPTDLRRDPIPKKKPAREVMPPAQPPQFSGGEPTHQGRNNNLPLASDGDFPSQSLNSASQQSLPDVNGADGPRPQLGIDQYDDEISPPAAVAAGIAYVLKTAPLLVLNPLGTVRKQIESPPVGGLEKIPLAAFLIPTYGVLILAQSWAGAIASAIAGQLSIVAFIIGPVAAVIGAVIGGLVAGFVGHPILSWLVNKLGGTSDARSRTTHMAMGMVTSLVLLIPTMLVLIFTALAARLSSISGAFALINIIPALLAIVATPLPIFVQWSWFRSYNVAKWFQTLLLVVAVLSLLGGLFSAVTTVMAAVNTMRGGAVPTVNIPNVPSTPDGVPTPTGADAGVPTTTDPDPTPTPTTTTTPTRTDPTPTTPTTTTTTTPTTTPTTTTTTTATTAPVQGTGEFGEYQKKRASIETALAKDPTLVLGGRIGSLYSKLSVETFNAEVDAEEQVLGRKRKYDPSKKAYLEKVKAAYVYQQTKSTVNDLYKLLPK